MEKKRLTLNERVAARQKKNRIDKGKVMWLMSLWKESNPEASEISEYEYEAVRSMWRWIQEPPEGLGNVVNTKKQQSFFRDIYERYQRRDVRR